jgi:hypothetical protein
MTEFIIGKIFNKQTDEEIRELKWLIGKEARIFTLGYGEPMIFDIEHGMIFSTTNVVNIDETDCGIWIETEGAIYRFDSNY